MGKTLILLTGHNWVQGQGAGARLDKKEDADKEFFDAMWVQNKVCG